MNERVFNVLIQIKNLYPNFHEKNVQSKYEPTSENIKADVAATMIKTTLAVLKILGYCNKTPYIYDLAAYTPQRGWQELLDECRFDNEIINHPYWTELYYGDLAK